MTEFQGWIIVALLVVLVVGHLAVGLYHLKHHRNADEDLGALWERNEFDRLIHEARKVLIKRPNNQSALYFGGKALRVRGHLAEAREYFERLARVEPTLRHNVQPDIDDIEQEQNKAGKAQE